MPHHIRPHPSPARRSELRAHKNLLPQAPSLCRPLSELPDPTALAGRLRPPSPDANLESSLQTPIHTFQFLDPVQRRLPSLLSTEQLLYCSDERRQLFLSQCEKIVAELNVTVRFRIP